MDLTIRPAAPADLLAITRIYAEAVRHGTASFELDPPDEAEMAQRMRSLIAGAFPYIVAEQAEILLGFAYAGPYRLRPAYRFTVEDSIYVAPQMQRRGVGRRLLDELIARSQARGFRQMIAVIGDLANVGSVELHRTAGFYMVGTFANTGLKFGRWLDSVLMQRALGEGAETLPVAGD